MNMERQERQYSRTYTEWAAWFAWRPVKLTATKQWVWLKTIYRREARSYGVEDAEMIYEYSSTKEQQG